MHVNDVAEVGPEVTRYAVGVGWMVDSCRECDNCRAREQQYCTGSGMVGTYGGVLDGKPTDGGYSQRIVVDEECVLGVPEGIGLDEAAPLLGAGITLYSPLRHWGARPGKRVAIVGLGELGHVGVKIAHAMGTEVTVLSQTLSKRDDGLRLGADDYRATSDPATFDELADTFDLIVNTVSAPVPVTRYLSLLRRDGTMVDVGAPPEPLEVQASALIDERRSWAGSLIGGIPETQETFDFCAEHGIGAEIETITADRIDEAYDRVIGSDVRYRFVIDTASMA